MIRSDFNFQKFGNDKYLITNYAGRYAFLDIDEFNAFCNGNMLSPDTLNRLSESFFCTNSNREKFIAEYSETIRKYRSYLFDGVGLHIFVLTKKCNMKCVYCQASTNVEGRMMSCETAEKCVDFALNSPNKHLSFEFQGGEPLANYETLKHIVKYSKEKSHGKVVEYNLVSNLTILNDEMAEFIRENRINVSTSLDGDAFLQNSNRPMPGGDGYLIWKKNYCRLKEITGRGCGAIQTTTRNSLTRYKEIVDTYIENDFKRIFIRPLTPLGYAAHRWKTIGYKAEEFLEFYRKSLDYILDKCKHGYDIAEGHACLFLDKILNHRAGSYTELTSPCGAALGQLAYNYDGEIYSCDEGRMLAEMGDKTFKLGDINMPYNKLYESPMCKLLANASCLECIPQCEQCVFSPYCGTCPVLNYFESKTAFPNRPNGYKCKIYKGILTILFEKLLYGTDEELSILKSWVK